MAAAILTPPVALLGSAPVGLLTDPFPPDPVRFHVAELWVPQGHVEVNEAFLDIRGWGDARQVKADQGAQRPITLDAQFSCLAVVGCGSPGRYVGVRAAKVAINALLVLRPSECV
jgi:hypothetical protein